MMDTDKRKEYNKKYYQENKEIILSKASQKVQCEFCMRLVCFSNINKHYTLPICKRKMELLQQQNLRRLQAENQNLPYQNITYDI